MNYIRVFEIMASVLFGIYLFWVSMQDAKELQVARYSHLLGVTAIVCMMVARSVWRTEHVVGALDLWGTQLWEIVVIWVLQFIGYKLRFYGLADVFTMGICATFYYFDSGRYQCLVFGVVLYAVSGILLLAIELARGNLKGWKLKQKVPYIPYIAVAFFLTKWVI